MKKLAAILAGLVALIVLAIVSTSHVSKEITAVADEFFLAVKENNIHEAYAHLSDGFRDEVAEDELADYLHSESLLKLTAVQWDVTSLRGETGKIIGRVSKASGSVLPVSVVLKKEHGQWKVDVLLFPVPDLLADLIYLVLPSEQELEELVVESMGAFVDSVRARDMAGFYGHVSNQWQQQHSVTNFNEFFSGLYDAEIDLSTLTDLQPYLDSEPFLGEDDSFIVSDYYQMTSGELLFEQQYIYEGQSWKLTGFRLYIDPDLL